MEYKKEKKVNKNTAGWYRVCLRKSISVLYLECPVKVELNELGIIMRRVSRSTNFYRVIHFIFVLLLCPFSFGK